MRKGVAMRGVFLSYRRSDSYPSAKSLFECLVRQYGDGKIFMDVARIKGGDDFLQAIQAALDASVALIAVVGKGWLTAADSTGGKRLEQEADYVRLEIERAFAGKLRVVPVLVDGATVPTEGELPPSLRPLCHLNFLSFDARRADEDFEAIRSAVEDAVFEPATLLEVEEARDEHPLRLRLCEVQPDVPAAFLAHRLTELSRQFNGGGTDGTDGFPAVLKWVRHVEAQCEPSLREGIIGNTLLRFDAVLSSPDRTWMKAPSQPSELSESVAEMARAMQRALRWLVSYQFHCTVASYETPLPAAVLMVYRCLPLAPFEASSGLPRLRGDVYWDWPSVEARRELVFASVTQQKVLRELERVHRLATLLPALSEVRRYYEPSHEGLSWVLNKTIGHFGDELLKTLLYVEAVAVHAGVKLLMTFAKARGAMAVDVDAFLDKHRQAVRQFVEESGKVESVFARGIKAHGGGQYVFAEGGRALGQTPVDASQAGIDVVVLRRSTSAARGADFLRGLSVPGNHVQHQDRLALSETI